MKTKSKQIALMTAMGTMLLLPLAASANLIVNGDFETPVLGPTNPNNIPVGSPALTGWDVGGAGGVDVNHVGSLQPYWPGNLTQWLDLTGGTGGGYIEQTFATVINTIYLVTFDTFNGSLLYSPGGPQNPGFDVSATGNLAASIFVTPGTGSFESYYFTATGASTTLRFTETTGFDSNAGWIDNVSVAAVPEASTVIAGALLLLPFGVSTLRILSRRANSR